MTFKKRVSKCCNRAWGIKWKDGNSFPICRGCNKKCELIDQEQLIEDWKEKFALIRQETARWQEAEDFIEQLLSEKDKNNS